MRHNIISSCNPCLLLLLLFSPLPTFAIPASSCHCFTDRSYDPARPAMADPYFLATTQNSLFALVFNVDKKNVVMKKQQGTSADDLWIAYWVASKSGMSADSLLQAKQTRERWQDVLAPLRLPPKSLGAGFSSALQAKASSGRLAEAVVDELFRRYRLLGDGELAALRLAGAANQELIIATLVAAKTGRSARQIYLEIKNGSATWGSLLLGARIDTKNMQQEISATLKLQPR